MARKPLWTEGLFVTQHHMQQLDRFHERRLAEVVHALSPYSFGVFDLEIDERLLASSQLRVLRLTAVLPDGTPIAVADGDDVIPPRPLEGAFPAQLRTLDVYVALAHEVDNAPNVELEGKQGALTRFTRAQSATPDYNTGTGELQMAWARPNLRILLGEERREAYDCIRIAQLTRSATGAIVCRETFVPPVLRVAASNYLLSGFRRILSVMTSRQRSLADSRRQRTAAVIDFQASDAAKFWLLNAINAFIPAISHIVDQGNTSAEFAYLTLTGLIGQLCTFAVDGDPTKLPKFNYLELGEVFEVLFARTIELLNTVIAERYIEVPLQRRDDGMYLGRFEDPQHLRYELFLAVSGSMPETTVRERLPRLMKVASWNHIGAILNSAINGARIETEFRPPGALPVKPGVTFFKLHRSSDFWTDISNTGTIALYHPTDPAGSVELQLFGVDPANV